MVSLLFPALAACAVYSTTVCWTSSCFILLVCNPDGKINYLVELLVSAKYSGFTGFWGFGVLGFWGWEK